MKTFVSIKKEMELNFKWVNQIRKMGLEFLLERHWHNNILFIHLCMNLFIHL